MVKYLPEQDVVVMDFVDLEHCSFDYDDFVMELGLHGIEDRRATWPLAILVNVGSGYAITTDISEEELRGRERENAKFLALLDKIQ